MNILLCVTIYVPGIIGVMFHAINYTFHFTESEGKLVIRYNQAKGNEIILKFSFHNPV